MDYKTCVCGRMSDGVLETFVFLKCNRDMFQSSSVG